MSAAIILGTHPEIIKMSPVIREFDRSGIGLLRIKRTLMGVLSLKNPYEHA